MTELEMEMEFIMIIKKLSPKEQINCLKDCMSFLKKTEGLICPPMVESEIA